VKWLRPAIETVLQEMAAAGHTAVLMVPLSFVSDHIETLHEIDQVYRQKARELGIVHFARSPSLNDHPDFIRALAALVTRRFADLCE
jgi:ferrochelatase